MELIPSRVGPTKMSDGVERNKAGIVLVVSSCMRAVSLHWAWEYLHQLDMPVTFFLFLLKFWSTGALLFTEKKVLLSSVSSFQAKEWTRLFIFSMIATLANFFWFEGLKHSGVVPTILTDFGDQTFAFLLSLMFASPATRLPPMKVKGVIILAIGYLILCALDPILIQEDDNHLWWFGIPERYVGGISLLLSVAFNSILSSLRKTGLDGVNNQSLSTLSGAMSCVILTPFALVSFFSHTDILFSEVRIFSFSFIFFFALIVFSFVMEAKIEAIVYKQLRQSLISVLQIGSGFLFLWLYGAIFGSPSISFTTWLCFFVIIVGLYSFLSAPGGGEEFLPSLRRSTFDGASSFNPTKMWKFTVFSLQQILANEDSRNIFMFLCLNLSFMFVEMAYGIWSNSLGLISDACHMLFDCVALGIGLFAAVIAKWEANQGFTYGYTRVQVLSGYVNGIFLVYVGLSIFREAMHRIYDPPDVQLDKLLIVSVAGLGVNLFGMFAFSHAHSHGGEACSGHGGGKKDHGHSHGGGHSHDHHGHSAHGGEEEGTDENMMGVYLHVLADTLGSVGVIISTLLIDWFGWTISDPICSLVLAVLILGSVLPLVKSSSRTLLQRPPEALAEQIPEIIDRVRGVPGVVGVKESHFWKLDQNVNVGTMVVEAGEGVDEQGVLGGVTGVIREFGISNVTVQVNKIERGGGGEFGGWNHQ